MSSMRIESDRENKAVTILVRSLGPGHGKHFGVEQHRLAGFARDRCCH